MMLKAVIIGCYEHVNLISNVFLEKGVNVLGFSPGGPDEELSQAVNIRNRFPQIQVFDDYKEMLKKIKPDIAGISPIMNRTADIAAFALEGNIHCLCEKPVAVSMEQLLCLEKAYKRSKAKLVSLLPMRYDPIFYTMHCQVAQGIIGEPVFVSIQKSYKLGIRADYFHKRSVYGGIFPFIGSHTLDLTCFVTGKRFETISCCQSNAHNGGNQEMESIGACLFTFAGGGSGVSCMDYFRPAAAGTWADNRMRIVGTKGILETYFDKVFLISHEHDTVELPLESKCMPFTDFIDDISQGTDNCVIKTEDCLYNARVTLLAREAADSGKIILVREQD